MNRSQPYWNNFYVLTNWPEDLQPPKDFISLQLANQPKWTYQPYPPFNLDEDECSSWVKWKTVTVPGKEDEAVKMLCVKDDCDPDDDRAPTRIGTKINFPLWMEKMESNTSRDKVTKKTNENKFKQQGETTIKEQLDEQTLVLKNMVHSVLENKIRYEFQRRFDNRSRSPKRQRSRSPRRHPSPKKSRPDDNNNQPNNQQNQLNHLLWMNQLNPQTLFNQLAMQQPTLPGLPQNNPNLLNQLSNTMGNLGQYPK